MLIDHTFCHNPILRECEDETHTPEMGTLESSRIFETSKFDCRGQNTLHWGVHYIIGKYQSVDVENGLAWAIWTSTAQVMAKRKAGVKLAVWLPTTKSQELTRP
jgi:hypothetical protein